MNLTIYHAENFLEIILKINKTSNEITKDAFELNYLTYKFS